MEDEKTFFEFGGVKLPINKGESIEYEEDGVKKTTPFPKGLVPSGINYVADGDPSQDFTTDVAQCAALEDAKGENVGKPVIIEGPKGTGKTTSIYYLAQETNNPLMFMQLTGSTDVSEFVGKHLVNKEGTFWEDGVLTAAAKMGYWLVLDEVNMALPEILAILQSVLDDRQTLALGEKGAGCYVKLHPNFRLFCTQNPMEDYVGTKELNAAFIDRFALILTTFPEARKEIQIIQANKRVKVDNAPNSTTNRSKEGVITRMVKLANACRKLNKEQKLMFEVSTRNLIDWAMMCDERTPIKKAARITLLNKADKEDRKHIMDEMDKQFREGEIWVAKANRKAITEKDDESEAEVSMDATDDTKMVSPKF